MKYTTLKESKSTNNAIQTVRDRQRTTGRPREPTQVPSSCILLVVVATMLFTIVAFIIIPPIVSKDNHHDEHTLTHPMLQSAPFNMAGDRELPMVETESGVIRGILKHDGVRIFHGVPYAKPPVGDLRWSPPEAPKPWHRDVYDATKKQSACLQNPNPIFPEKKMNEDCLYLEIFVPPKQLIHNNLNRAPIPVMFYLHGGEFRTYSAHDDIYDGSSIAKREGVIVVVAEYRLGAMGFLVHGDKDDMKGNWGLLDQRFALTWVSKNIAAFGGDPDKVTLVGQSAGAQSSIIHLLSEKSSRYFRAVILESPPVPLPVKNFSEGIAQTELVAKETHCLKNDSKSFDMKCLRNADAQAILRAQKLSESFGDKTIDRAEPWGPLVDHVMVQGPLMEGFKDGNSVPKKPILWGVTAEEAVIFVRTLYNKPTGPLAYFLANRILAKNGVDTKDLSKFYPRSNDSRTGISRMLTDFLFRCPMRWVARKFLPTQLHNSTWTYLFERSIIISANSSLSICSGHSCHGINIPYVFNTFEPFNVTKSVIDEHVSNAIEDYYGNFIKYGNPNGKNYEIDSVSNKNHLPYWPSSYEDNSKYQTLVFGKKGHVRISNGLEENTCKFWYSAFPN